MKGWVWAVVADGVESLDLFLVLRNVVAETEGIAWETHSVIYVTDPRGGSYKSKIKGSQSKRIEIFMREKDGRARWMKNSLPPDVLSLSISHKWFE